MPESDDVLVALPRTALKALSDAWEQEDDATFRRNSLRLVRDVFDGQDGYLHRLTGLDL